MRLDTSILATNKFILAEALPALYATKIVRGTTLDFDRLLQYVDFAEHVRYIEIADCVGTHEAYGFHIVLQRLQSLTQVRSLTILSDCLGYLEDRAKGYLTVSEFCEEAQLGKATCVDIGVYELEGKFSSYWIVNRRLSQM